MPPTKKQIQVIKIPQEKDERDETLEQLKSARDRYEHMFHFAPVAYIVFGVDGLIKDINNTAAFMLGTERSKIIDSPFANWVRSSDRAAFHAHLQSCVKTQGKSTVEIAIETNETASIIHLQIESTRNIDSETGDMACHSVLKDCTAIKNSQSALIQKQSQLRLVTDALPTLVCYINIDLHIQFANRAFSKWFQCPIKDILDTHIQNIMGHKICQKIANVMQLTLDNEIQEFELEFTSISSTRHYFQISLIPDYDDFLTKRGFIFLARDISQEKMLEMIDKKRLQEAAHVARLCNMGEMASQLAHELNQPLTALHNYLEAGKILMNTKQDSQDNIAKLFEMGSQQTLRASGIIKRIRHLASKKELQKKKTSVNELIKSIVELIEPEARYHSIDIRMELDDNLPEAIIDALLIEQVILNLTRNALEAMLLVEDDRHLLVIVSSSKESDKIEVAVSDTGPGVDPHELNQLFEPFHTTKENGLGLGLTICRSIIEAHKGEIWVESNNDKGATFRFSIPASY